VTDPVNTILKRGVSLAGAAAEIYLPFVTIAVVFVVTGQSSHANVLDVIGASPVMTVVAFTVSLLYLPAVLTLVAASPTTRIRDAINPKYIGSAIRFMEGEYIAAVGFIMVLMGAMWGLGRLIEFVPVAPRILYAAAAVYTVLAGGLVFGRLYARFKEQLEASL